MLGSGNMLFIWYFSLPLVANAVLSLSGTASTTTYFDCCKASCGYPSKASFLTNLVSVLKDTSNADANANSGCAGGTAFTAPQQVASAVDATHAIGFAATGPLGGHNEADLCCACAELTFTSGPVNNQKMIVQITNTGADLAQAQFDLAMPGGGAGTFSKGCPTQYPGLFSYGAQYGGVTTRDQCSQLPPAQIKGCHFRFDWFKGADNPTVNYQMVPCPVSLTDLSGCRRQDDPVVVTGTKSKIKTTTRPTTFVPSTNTLRPAGNNASNNASNNAVLPNNVTISDKCKVKVYEQCDGLLYTGNKCCAIGTECVRSDAYYSQCRPEHKGTGCHNYVYDQCDGLEFVGEKCCARGSVCTLFNKYYSQCLRQ